MEGADACRFFAVYDSMKREDLLDVYTDRSFFSVAACVLSADAQQVLSSHTLLSSILTRRTGGRKSEPRRTRRQAAE